MIDLEDFSEDIIGKAMRGLGVSVADLSVRSGVAQERIRGLLNGDFEEDAAHAISPHLELSADALVTSGKSMWRPQSVDLEGLEIFNTPWRDMRVNAFLIWDPASGEAAAFDTGADAVGMIDLVKKKELTIKLRHEKKNTKKKEVWRLF